MKITKLLLAMCLSLVAIFTNFIDVSAAETTKFPLTITDSRVEYTQTIAFDFMEKLDAPTAKADGRGAPLENLVSNYGESYVNDPYLHDEVINFRKWEWNAMYTSLDRKAKERPDYLDTYRLQAEAYLVNKEYNQALSQLDRILRVNPKDIHALSLSILANKCGALSSQTGVRLKALKLISPEAEQKVRAILKDCDDNNVNKKNYSGEQLYGITPDVIAVFGQSPNNDGTPSAALLTRLTKAKEMAEKYPNVKIVLSGGPVKTEFAEANVMAKWLKENGIAEERLLLDDQARDTPGNAMGMVNLFKTIDAHNVLCIGTIMHCPRAMTVLMVYGKAIGYDMELDAVGGGDQPTNTQKNTERLYTYVNAFRAGYLYTKEDFKDLKPITYTVSLYDKNKELITKEEVEIGEKITTEAPVINGYEFVKWVDENNLEVNKADVILQDISLFANYEEIQYSIKLELDGGKLEKYNDVIVKYSDKIVFPETPKKDNYKFLGWYIGESLLTNTMTYGEFAENAKDGEIVLQARWEKMAITNTKTNKSDNIVNTGDSSNIIDLFALLAMSVFICYLTLRKKEKNYRVK